MASNGISDSSKTSTKLQKTSTREFYFHICGGNHLNITRADTHPLWKDVPEVTSPDNTHHTIQCAEMTRLQSRRSINGGDIVRLKDKLRKFIKEVEIHQMSMSFRYEARFGHLFVHPKNQIQSNPVTSNVLKGNAFKREFITRLVGQCNVEALKQEHCEVKMIPDVITYKIRFTCTQYGEDLDGVCYIEEKAGSFTLLGAHNSYEEIIGLKIDVIRPGRTYDIRIVTGVHNYREENVPDCVKTVAEKIATSMTRSSFNREEIRLQVVGENFEVEYIREKRTHECKWKKNPQWIFVEHDIRQLCYEKENRQILKRDEQFCPIPITFTQSDCRKEVEFWSKVHCQPDGSSHWTTEQMLDGFDKFMGTCFDIAGLLDDATSAPPIPPLTEQ